MKLNYLHNSPLNNRTFSNLLCHSTPFVSIGQWVVLHDLFMFPLFIFPHESVQTTAVPSGSWLSLGFSSRISMSSPHKYFYRSPSTTSQSTLKTNEKRPLRYFPPSLKRTAEPGMIQPKKTRTQNVRLDNNTNSYCIKMRWFSSWTRNSFSSKGFILYITQPSMLMTVILEENTF